MQNNNILVVEDSKFFIQVIKEFLGRSGYNILTASDGNEALQIIDNNPPDLILMDLYMAGMDGDKCCRKLKSNSTTKSIPIIMVTSAGKDEDIEKCNNSGCDDYVTKPVDKMVLLDKVKKYLSIPTREAKRAPICINAKYYYDSQEYTGIIFSISESGMFIKGEMILEKNSNVKAIFDMPHIAKEIEVEGKVAWNTDERDHLPNVINPGFGMEFSSIDKNGIEAINTYINIGDYIV